MTPLPITLYIPYYKARETITYVMEAVAQLTPPPERILLIDDGSEENVKKFLKKYKCEIIVHAKNKGLAAARNTALKVCKTEFIASLDSDVVPEKNWLNELFKAIKKPNIEGVGGFLRENYTDTIVDKWRSKHRVQHWGTNFLKNPPHIAGANTLFRTKTLLNIGGYDERFRTNSEDVAISKALYKLGFTLCYVPTAKALHLRKDTLLSLFRMDWRWSILSYRENGKYTSLKKILKINYLKFRHLLHIDINDKDWDCVLIDILLASYTLLKDIPEWIIQKSK